MLNALSLEAKRIWQNTLIFDFSPWTKELLDDPFRSKQLMAEAAIGYTLLLNQYQDAKGKKSFESLRNDIAETNHHYPWTEEERLELGIDQTLEQQAEHELYRLFIHALALPGMANQTYYAIVEKIKSDYSRLY